MITSRYLKANDYASAADVLSNGSLLLLRAGQGGSGGDLAMMLVNDVYVKGEYEVTDENKRRLLNILAAYPADDPTRKRFVQEAMNWSAKFGEDGEGDADLHHAIGALYAQGMRNPVGTEGVEVVFGGIVLLTGVVYNRRRSLRSGETLVTGHHGVSAHSVVTDV